MSCPIASGEPILRREKREISILVARKEVTNTHARYAAGEQVAGPHPLLAQLLVGGDGGGVVAVQVRLVAPGPGLVQPLAGPRGAVGRGRARP